MGISSVSSTATAADSAMVAGGSDARAYKAAFVPLFVHPKLIFRSKFDQTFCPQL